LIEVEEAAISTTRFSGVLSLGLPLALIAYGSYFVWKAENVRLE
jgi:hypothetical protein